MRVHSPWERKRMGVSQFIYKTLGGSHPSQTTVNATANILPSLVHRQTRVADMSFLERAVQASQGKPDMATAVQTVE